MGICGSLAFHARVGASLAPARHPAASSMNDPPRATAFPSAPIAHSATFPCMSYSPHVFGALVETGCVRPCAFALYHAKRPSFPSSSPKQYAPSDPARHACSHSASVGSRYLRPVFSDSHRQNSRAPCAVIEIAGCPACPYPRSGGMYGRLGRVTASAPPPSFLPSSSPYTKTSYTSHVISVLDIQIVPSPSGDGTGIISISAADPGTACVNAAGGAARGCPAPRLAATSAAPAPTAARRCTHAPFGRRLGDRAAGRRLCMVRGIALVIALCLMFPRPGAAQPVEAVGGTPPRQQAPTGPRRFEFTRMSMGDAARIVVHAQDEQQARAAAAAAFNRLDELEAVMTDYRDDSELMRLCAAPADTDVPLSEDLFGVLSHALRIAAATGGAYDPTLGPLVALWRKARADGSLPAPEALRDALARSGHDKLVLDARRRTACLTTPGMRLDLGGIGKGYAADAAAAVLEARGLTSYLVSLGGDVRVGEAPPGEPGWRIALLESGDEEVVLVRSSISTSGDAHQFVEIGGERYSHIVDPRTGLGLRRQATVSVVATDSTTADALATALSVSGGEEAEALLTRFPGAGVRMVAEVSGQPRQWASPRFPALDGTPHAATDPDDPKNPPEGFTALFNGHDLAAWEPVAADPPELAKMSPEERAAAEEAARAEMLRHWRIEGDTLHMAGGWTSLATRERYHDFELRLDWKIAKDGDSGIYLRDCPQVQIWDNPAGSGGLYNNQRGGAAPSRVADRPAGEWNTFRIVMVGDRVTVYLNGELVADRVPLENYWDRASPVPHTGRIWLQAHGTPLWFRNISIRPLGN